MSNFVFAVATGTAVRSLGERLVAELFERYRGALLFIAGASEYVFRK